MASWRPWLENPTRQGHICQFYRSPAFLREAVGLWTSQALGRGGGAILVGTPPHLDLVRGHLVQQGLDPDALECEGRLAVLDAKSLLATFMVDGTPDRDRFFAVALPLLAGVRAACPPGAEVRAWGEMVDVLRQQGNLQASRRLERAWSELLSAENFRLLCSYGVDNFDPVTHTLFDDLTSSHSQLIPEEDFDRLEQAVEKALVELFGEAEAARLRATLLARSGARLHMPAGEAALVGLVRIAPQLGSRVLERTRLHYEQAEA